MIRNKLYATYFLICYFVCIHYKYRYINTTICFMNTTSEILELKKIKLLTYKVQKYQRNMYGMQLMILFLSLKAPSRYIPSSCFRLFKLLYRASTNKKVWWCKIKKASILIGWYFRNSFNTLYIQTYYTYLL